jgi:hypothetical protein
MMPTSHWGKFTRVLSHLFALAGLAAFPLTAAALPPPLTPAELAARSDLVILGRVARVWGYEQWRQYLRDGGLGARGATLLKEAPATDAGVLALVRNFPYGPAQVAVDGVFLAEVQVDQTLKGEAREVILIPFVKYHFLTTPLEGPWTERAYRQGERLQLYLRRNGPFFESTWWNAVSPVKD